MTAEVETTSAVLVETDAEGVCTLTFNRPERRNGWAADLEDAYYAALTDAARDPAVRAVVVTGAGPTFCPGADMARLGDLSTDGASLPHRPVDVPRTFPKPLIAAINGACAGVGLVQALFCHIRFAADSARFSTAFPRRGLVAEYGIAWTLPRLVGLENALDLLLSGRTFDASEAKALGLVSRVVARVDVLAAAQAYAREIAENCAPAAVAVIAAQVFDAAESTYADALARAHLETDKRIGSADLREGVASGWRNGPRGSARCPGRASDVPGGGDRAGPSGLYAAAALLTSDVPVSVEVLDRLPAPYGLVRYGVAPDHVKMKSVIGVLQRPFDPAELEFLGGVHVGEGGLPLDVLRPTSTPVVHAAEELQLRRVERALQHPDDRLHLHVVGRDAVADEAVRRGQAVEHLHAHRHVRREQRRRRVEPGRPRSDHSDAIHQTPSRDSGRTAGPASRATT